MYSHWKSHVHFLSSMCVSFDSLVDFLCTIFQSLQQSYLEVYKEHIKDLLATSETAPPVRLFDSADGLIIKGLREEVVTSPEDVFRVLAQGESRRQVGATSFNLHSSRSHVIVRLWIEGRSADGATSSKPSTSSSLSLVDLAGSESVRLTGSNDRRQEGHYINQSLMALGKVVYALSEFAEGENMKKKHVPYRDSKLTRLLQPSLSGSAQVVLICCISPHVNHLEESHNTFKFAIRAKKIPQKAELQETADEQTLLQSYRQEIDDLRQQLADLKKQQQQASVDSTVSSSSSVDRAEEDEMLELAESIKKLEHLIIRSKVAPRPEDLLDDFTEGNNDEDDDEDVQKSLLATAAGEAMSSPAKPVSSPLSPVSSPRDQKTDRDMEVELKRIQGILGSVLKKRRNEQSADEKVKLLRMQLEKQEEHVSLRKADAAFLQKQLEEKDDLLQEVSKLLEAVEIRQSELERENQRLRMELEALKRSKNTSTSSSNGTPNHGGRVATPVRNNKTSSPPVVEATEVKPQEASKLATTATEENAEDALDDLLGPIMI